MEDSHTGIGAKLQTFLSGKPPVFLCIGSDRITGDCLGPMVGQLLISRHSISSFVYGNLECPVTALNLEYVAAFIERKHEGCSLVAIDSCIGRREDIGSIRIFRGGLLPGSADGKNLPCVGDISITATVCDDIPASKAFASVRLGLIYGLASRIASGIANGLRSAPKTDICTARKRLQRIQTNSRSQDPALTCAAHTINCNQKL